MKINKNLVLAGLVTTVAAGSLLGITTASADTATSGSIIDKIASKFNLNKDEVKAVFEEERTERQTERAAEMSERLQEKVDSGDITAEQKTLIEQKMTEQQTAHEAERTDLEAWAEQNGIDMKYVMGGRGHRAGSDDRLADAVSNGDITEAQKTLIEQKQEELEAKREANRDALKQWAEDNNIDLQDIMPMGGGHGRGGMGDGPREMN